MNILFNGINDELTIRQIIARLPNVRLGSLNERVRYIMDMVEFERWLIGLVQAEIARVLDEGEI